MRDFSTVAAKPARGVQPAQARVSTTASSSPDNTRSVRLTWYGAWIVWTLVIVGLTTMPWRNFVGHAHWQRVQWVPFADARLTIWFVADVLGNIVLFVPFGIYGAMSLHNDTWKRRICRAGCYAAVLSMSVEFFQVYCHNRMPAMTDVCSNVVGALAGALFMFRRSVLQKSRVESVPQFVA